MRSGADSLVTPHSPVVVQVMWTLGTGGAEVRTLEIVRALRQTNVELWVVGLGPTGGSLEGEFRAAGRGVAYFPLKRPGFIVDFYRFLRRVRPQAVHANIYYASAIPLALAKLAGVRVRVANFHTDKVPVRGGIKHTVLKWMLGWSATDIVAVSPGVLAAHKQAVQTEKVRMSVIANGVNVKAFSPTRFASSASPFGLRVGSVLVHVGRGELPTKNRVGAVEVLAACRARGLDVGLSFVGRDGRDEEEAMRLREDLLQVARDLDVEEFVEFLGERSDVPLLLSKADAMLVTSVLEGLPGVVVEALASGLPVVAHALPGVQYLAERSDLIYPLPIDAAPGDWVASVRQALRIDSRVASREMRNASLVMSEFDSQYVMERYLELWRVRDGYAK